MFKKVSDKTKNVWHQATKRRLYWKYESYFGMALKTFFEVVGLWFITFFGVCCILITWNSKFGKK